MNMEDSNKAYFSTARKNMVDSQLMTNGVILPHIIESFSLTPREIFVPESFFGAAYLDEDIKISNDAFLIDPVVHARMLQHVNPQPYETMLLVGDSTGYGAAVVSRLVATVVVMEGHKGALDAARIQWEAQDCSNVAVISGNAREGEAAHAPYNIIVMLGSVAQEPEQLLNLLDIGGRLVCVLRTDLRSVGRICIFTKVAKGQISQQSYEDAATPYLAGFEPEQRFNF